MHLGDVYAGKSKDKELSDLRKENKTLTNKVLSLEGKLRTKGTGSGYRDREKEESLKKKFGDKKLEPKGNKNRRTYRHFNSADGCSTQDCPYIHQCSKSFGNNVFCWSKTHNILTGH